MKIRTDYVSNSSSSSFVVLASKYIPNDGHTLTIEDFDNLDAGEVFVMVFPDICDGDFVVRIDPELMMDFDMREKPIVIDMDKCHLRTSIYKMRKFRSDEWDTETIYDASDWGCRTRSSGSKGEIEDIPRKKDERIGLWNVDDHSPRTTKDIVEWMEREFGTA